MKRLLFYMIITVLGCSEVGGEECEIPCDEGAIICLDDSVQECMMDHATGCTSYQITDDCPYQGLACSSRDPFDVHCYDQEGHK